MMHIVSTQLIGVAPVPIKTWCSWWSMAATAGGICSPVNIHSDYKERVQFWERRNISTDIREQICYLFHQNDTILHRGPLVYMTCTAISEVKKGTNRGLYKDCLHAVYLPYCNSFFTRDKHFIEMECGITSGLWKRVVDIKDFCEGIQDALRINT